IETRYIDEHGIPLTAEQFLEKLTGFIPDLYASEAHLRQIWSQPETREELVQKLAERGIDQEQLDRLRHMFEAEHSDIFDVLLHISYANDIITRRQRASRARQQQQFFEVYEHLKARDFLRFVLDRYEKDDIQELRRERLAQLVELHNLGTTRDAAQIFGGINRLIDAFYQLQKHLYAS
ncbi:DEAD/DEAH box helicase, partial [candidate division KSB3 bacterium]|nr:DEAD/DEAH box helicase [candidate division KSB3 bacterium]